tara:strand:- start:13022 stop:13366 length:345 start_codon:yes stop_codon:yes gene_type:complete
MEKQRYDVGCYFDGAFGFKNNALRIIDFAEGLGWENLPEEITNLSEMDDDEIDAHFEIIVEVIDELEGWLTDNTIHEENEYWCWIDGDFGLWAHCDECGEPINKGEGCPMESCQ